MLVVLEYTPGGLVQFAGASYGALCTQIRGSPVVVPMKPAGASGRVLCSRRQSIRPLLSLRLPVGWCVTTRSTTRTCWPSALYVAVLSASAFLLLHYLGICGTAGRCIPAAFHLPTLHPMQAPLILIRGAFQPLDAWEWVYGVMYSGLALGVLFWWCQRAFARFVVAAEGA